MDRFDVIIIGAGINGLVSAVALSMAGQSVAVLRMTGQRQYSYSDGWYGADGFLFPTPVSRLENFPLDLVHKLGLERYGVRPAPRRADILVSPVHGMLIRDADPAQFARRLRTISSMEADAYADYSSEITRHFRYLHEFAKTAKGVLPESRDLRRFLAKVGQDDLWQASALWSSSMRDWLNRHFSLEPLKVLLAATALDGWFGGMGLGPLAPTSAAGLIMDPASLRADWASPLLGPVDGGGEALLGALERAAIDHGVVFVDDVNATEIAHEKKRVRGVALEGGQFLASDTVIGDLDLKVLLLSLFSWKTLPQDLVFEIAAIRNRAQAAQINFVLDGLPEIEGLADGILSDGTRLHLVADLDSMEQAHDAWRLNKLPSTPPVTFSVEGEETDEEGKARIYATAHLQFIPGELDHGEWTDELRIRLISGVVNRLVRISPGFEKRLLDARLVLPIDYEERLGLVGGHLYGGCTALDQTLFHRPTPTLATAQLPVRGLHVAGPGLPLAPHFAGLGGYHLACDLLEGAGGIDPLASVSRFMAPILKKSGGRS